MLVTRRGDGLRCVTQYEHGALAGELAERWGNDRFAMPAEPLAAALTVAAAHHDDGWRELDDVPAHNPDAGRPAHFLELPLERTIPPYGRGVASVYARDRLGGAIVEWHWTGLYSGRWGLQSSGGPVPHPLAEEVVEKGERRRAEVLRESWGFEGRRSAFEANAWHAYEVLQALDITSLALSLIDPAVPSDLAIEPPLLTATLSHVDQPPGARVLPSIPTTPLGEHLDLFFSVPEPGIASLDPWPFTDSSFAVELPSRPFARARLGEEETTLAYREAPVEPIRWTLRAA